MTIQRCIKCGHIPNESIGINGKKVLTCMCFTWRPTFSEEIMAERKRLENEAHAENPILCDDDCAFRRRSSHWRPEAQIPAVSSLQSS